MKSSSQRGSHQIAQKDINVNVIGGEKSGSNMLMLLKRKKDCF